MNTSKGLFAGLAGLQLEPAEYPLGSGICLKQTYAHLMAHFMMAYTPAPPGKHHPPPWSQAGGGMAFDIHVQLEVPSATLLGLSLDPRFIPWWITALLRLRLGPAFCVPVIGEQSFEAAKTKHDGARYYLIETHQTFLLLDPHARRTATEVDLAWVAKYWQASSRLFYEHGPFGQLFVAADQACFANHAELALVWLWGGLEAVFSPSKTELRYRTSSTIASFLEPAGIPRMNAQKAIARLYDSRSAAAHGREEKQGEALQATYAIARRAITKIIEDNRVPTHTELEAKLFGADPS